VTVTIDEDLAKRFEQDRQHLRGVAYRMLGSLSEADDAVQEAWLRLSRSDTSSVDNLTGWLTTVVARVSLDMLRSRKARREDPATTTPREADRATAPSPEQEAQLADSVGLALLVVLDTLDPAERLAFVLHDLFGMAFEEIAEIVGRSPAATRQLASRARRRIQGVQIDEAELSRQRHVVDAFLAALRAGDFDALVQVLDPDVVVRTAGQPEIRGAATWAKGAVQFGRMAGAVAAALVDGNVGLVFAPGGRLKRALRIVVANDKIAEVEVIFDPARLATLEIRMLA
jgi:RNA polymerase sigma-70 factor (ECF subfamily)